MPDGRAAGPPPSSSGGRADAQTDLEESLRVTELMLPAEAAALDCRTPQRQHQCFTRPRWRSLFTQGIEFTFPGTTLAPDAYLFGKVRSGRRFASFRLWPRGLCFHLRSYQGSLNDQR
jgi:hypothetical protein